MFRLLFILLTLFVCQMVTADLWAKDLKVSTYPEASEIFVKALSDSDFKKIGVSPLSISFDDIVKNFTNSDVFIVEIRKDDYKPFRIIISEFGSADVELTTRLEAKNDYEMTSSIEEVASEILESQRLVRASKYDEGLEKLRQLEKKYSKVSLISEMQGNIFYLKKDYRKALDAYTTAFLHNPKNLDAYRMKLYLEKSLTPTSSEKDIRNE